MSRRPRPSPAGRPAATAPPGCRRGRDGSRVPPRSPAARGPGTGRTTSPRCRRPACRPTSRERAVSRARPRAGAARSATEQAAAAVDDPRGRPHPRSPPHHRCPERDQSADAAGGGPGQLLRVEPAETPADQADPPSGGPVQPLETFAQRIDDTAGGAPVGAQAPAGHVVAEGAEGGPERERGGVTGHEPGSTSTGCPSPRRAVVSNGQAAARAATSSPARGGSVRSEAREGTRLTAGTRTASTARTHGSRLRSACG